MVVRNFESGEDMQDGQDEGDQVGGWPGLRCKVIRPWFVEVKTGKTIIEILERHQQTGDSWGMEGREHSWNLRL